MESMRETCHSQTMINVDHHNSLSKIVISHLASSVKELYFYSVILKVTPHLSNSRSATIRYN